MTDIPTVTDIRRKLVAESNDFYHRRKAYFLAMRADIPAADRGPAFDAYEGFVTAGAYGWLIAAMLRKIAEDHGEEYAADLGAGVAEVMESGIDWLEDANDDLDEAGTATA